MLRGVDRLLPKNSPGIRDAKVVEEKVRVVSEPDAPSRPGGAHKKSRSRSSVQVHRYRKAAAADLSHAVQTRPPAEIPRLFSVERNRFVDVGVGFDQWREP